MDPVDPMSAHVYVCYNTTNVRKLDNVFAEPFGHVVTRNLVNVSGLFDVAIVQIVRFILYIERSPFESFPGIHESYSPVSFGR